MVKDAGQQPLQGPPQPDLAGQGQRQQDGEQAAGENDGVQHASDPFRMKGEVRTSCQTAAAPL
jgi:hypothetical protein